MFPLNISVISEEAFRPSLTTETPLAKATEDEPEVSGGHIRSSGLHQSPLNECGDDPVGEDAVGNSSPSDDSQQLSSGSIVTFRMLCPYPTRERKPNQRKRGTTATGNLLSAAHVSYVKELEKRKDKKKENREKMGANLKVKEDKKKIKHGGQKLIRV